MKLWKLLLLTFSLLRIATSLVAQSNTTNWALDSLVQKGHINTTTLQVTDTAYHILVENYGIDDLVQLSQDEQPLIRGIALLSLLKKRIKDRQPLPTLELFLPRLRDTAQVYFQIKDQHYTYMDSTTLAVLYTQKLCGTYSMNTLFLPGERYEPTPSERIVIDSVIACTVLPIEAERRGLYRQIPLRENYYPIIRQMVVDGDVPAMAYLAKFQKPEDVSLLMANLPKGTLKKTSTPAYWSILREYQHPTFFAFLQQQKDTQWKNGGYLDLVSAYQDSAALKLLEACLAIGEANGKGDQVLTQLRYKLAHHYTPIYDNLYIRTITEWKHPQYLKLPPGIWETKGDELVALYRKWMASDSKWYRRTASNIYVDVKKYLEKHRPEEVMAQVWSPIQAGGRYRDYAKSFYYIQQSKAPYFVDRLFDLLDREPLPENRFFIARLLLDYEDTQITERLQAFYAAYPDKKPTLKAAEQARGMYKDLSHYGKEK